MNKLRITIKISTILLIFNIILIAFLLFKIFTPKKIALYGLEFKENNTVIDLSSVKVCNVDELMNNLSEFKKVKTVYFGDQKISAENKEQLEEKYPNIDFEVGIYHNFYGLDIFEDETVLDLSDVEIDNNISTKLAILPNIKEVILYNHTFTKDEQIAIQEQYPDKTFKWKVDVLSKKIDNNIETLDLSNSKITDLSEFKKSLKLLPNLKKLDMSNTNLTNEQLGQLREDFPNIQIDWIIHLGKWSLRTDSISFSVLIVTYDYKRLTSDDIQVLKYCTKLQALDLGHQNITDITVIGNYLPNLRVLILADNKITDISPIAKLKHLHYLELFMNDITDLTPLASCKEMVDLNICYNPHLSNIDGILELPLLERLWLISTKITSASFKQIRDTYPNVNLVTSGTGSTNNGWRTHERYYKLIDMYYNNYIDEVFTKYEQK